MTLILVHEIAHTFGMGEANQVVGHDDNAEYCVMSKLPSAASGVVQKYNHLVTNPQDAFCDSCKQAMAENIANGLCAASDD